LEEILRCTRDDKRLAQSARRCVVIHGKELPPEWAGKPHALAQGSAAARGEWLCFIDADTFARPGLLSSTLAAAQTHRADLFSILTAQELGSFWEKVILPVIFTALSFGFPARRVNDPSTPDAIANGQFILIRRSIYEAIGGHAGVHDRIDEDKALAERVKHSGYRLIVADGRTVASTRMYTSLPEIWEGWTKNIFLGMRGRLGLLLFGGVVGLLGALALPLWLVAGLVWFASTESPLSALVAGEAILLWAYLLGMRSRVALAMHISPLFAFTLPLGALVFTAMMFTSAFRVLSGRGVTWKGRIYKNTTQS
jgi:chlorobactene glucosyltransferase